MAASTKLSPSPKGPTVKPLTKRKAWLALKTHHKQIQGSHLRKLFDDDPKRGEHFVVDAAGIYFDYSKNRITEKSV
jgi:glucose-6-phosphate isomerase